MSDLTILVYDLEIKNLIRSSKEPQLPNRTYAYGWGDHKGMGISYLCAYDYGEGRYRVFDDSNKRDFERLLVDHLLVTFNGKRFDDPVVEACWEIDMSKNDKYDLMEEIPKRISLDKLATANLRMSKSGHGKDAPLWYQDGHHASVIDYCLQDVKVTKDLLALVCKYGWLLHTNGEKMTVRHPGVKPQTTEDHPDIHTLT